MRRGTKTNKYKEKTYSSKIEAARDKIIKANDIVKLSKIFFPQSAAFKKRASFVAIFIEVRNAMNKRIRSLNHIPNKFDINQSCFVKARAKMVRIGLIGRYNGYWGFSNKFENSLQRLIGKVHDYQIPSETVDEENLESTFIEFAKAEPVFFQLRKKE